MADVAEGTTVDGRYRVRSRIGSGGMADVYSADDSQLGREVALKVLHRRFARDREFVERFRREASAAAGLQHPNVVSVFDRGEYDGTYYIAMELLPGRTLKEVIQQEAPLDQLRSISLAIQILQAASFAHRRGVIHRDFKPHNVIVGPDDRLKVTDFGIARAGTSEMTETGSIMGTAQYLSPEQAQGQRVGAPSDLYSIGVIIYEMLTGRVPFAGDSAVSIALKHVSEPPPRLRELRPDVHPRLEQAVGRALLKDPAQRYASADEFIAALEQARAAITSGEAGPAVVGGTTAWSAPVVPVDDDPRGRRWPLVLLALLLLGLAIGAALWHPWSGSHTVARTVPTVVGSSSKRATLVLRKAGFHVALRGQESDERRGRVLSQDPNGGAEAEKGATVTVVVSTGPGKILVPSVVNLPQKEALRELNDLGFRVRQEPKATSSVEKGLAISTSPKEGTSVPKKSEIVLFVSSGAPLVSVPGVVGQEKADARATLEGAGFQVSATAVASDQPKNQVLSQNPATGAKVAKGSRVAITVSKGPEKVEVPDVTGEDKDSARSELRAAGFRVRVTERKSQETKGTVISQSPSGGSSQVKGSQVTIVVAVPQDDGGSAPGDGGGATGPGSVPPDGTQGQGLSNQQGVGFGQ